MMFYAITNAEMNDTQKHALRMFAAQKICCKCDGCSVSCPNVVVVHLGCDDDLVSLQEV